MKDKYEDLKRQIALLTDAAETGRTDKEQRFRKSYLYYMCMAPEKEANEMSGYVEPVLRKVVETVKPSLMNIFTENEKRAVSFRPLTRSALGIEMVESGAGETIAEMVDAFINKTFIQENNGFEILDRALTEVLVSGDVFLKYFVEEVEEEEEVELEKVPEEAIQTILNDWPDTDTEKMNKALRRRNGLVSGEFKVKRKEKPIRIEFIPFGDLYVSGSYENIKDARYVGQRMYKTVGELIEMGYDADKVEASSMPWVSDNTLSTKKLVNFGVFSDEDLNPAMCADPLERVVSVYEHYLYSSLVDKKAKKSKLYRVISTDSEILDVEEASRIPFIHGKMEQVPGSFWGRSMYDKTYEAQDIISRLVRAVEFNAADGAYGRYIAIKGMYDKQSLLNNRPGSVIEVNSEVGAAAVQRFEKEQLPASVDGLISRLTNSYKEDAMSFVGVDVTGSGMSATAAAITANSADLKDKVIARTLAYTLFRPLFEGIYDIIVAEELEIGEIPNPQVAQAQAGVESGELSPEVMMEIPQVLKITGADLPSVSDFVIDVNTANDDAMMNSQLLNLMTMMAQLPPGLINVQEIAAQFTGMSVEEVVKFFPVAPAPTEEETMIKQQQEAMNLEATQANVEVLKGQVSKLAMEVVEIEEGIKRKASETDAKIKRDEEESFRKIKMMEMREIELQEELKGNKIQLSEAR